MLDGQPSLTARHVAAHRLGFEREPAPFGDPQADHRLAADVAEGLEPGGDERTARYLAGRTRFFDRVVVRAVKRGVNQIVSIGAGYDGRSLRYSKDGVRWFEVDHPATQEDKLARLQRLAIASGETTFVAFDLSQPGLAARLIELGLEPDAPAQMICEGVTAYLEPKVIKRMLDELRALAAPGTRLALSTTPQAAAGKGDAERSRRLEQAGEPRRSELDPQAMSELVAAARWRELDLPERAQRVGFIALAPEWAPAPPTAPATAGVLGRYMERTFHRDGVEQLAERLRECHGVEVERVRRLEVGVHSVLLAGGRRWVARILPRAWPADSVRALTEVLELIAEDGFPAERLVPGAADSDIDGQDMVLTEQLDGHPGRNSRSDFGRLGELLGRLHRLQVPPQLARGGAWHHLAAGGPAEELDAAIALLTAAEAGIGSDLQEDYWSLRLELQDADDCEGLPTALLHPDFVPANTLVTAAGPALIDWVGTGVGPRLWSLGFLLWAAGMKDLACVEAVARGYAGAVQLEREELERLEGAVAVRPLVFDAWAVATGRRPLGEVVAVRPGIRDRAAAIAARAASALSP